MKETGAAAERAALIGRRLSVVPEDGGREHLLRRDLERREQLCLLLEGLIETMADGLAALDGEGRLIHLSDSLREAARGPADAATASWDEQETLPARVLERLREEAGAIGSGRSRRFELGWERPENGVCAYHVTGVAGKIPGAEHAEGDGALTLFAFHDRTREASLEAELARARNLAALGQMAGTVAHELRNPLGAIQGFATLLRRDLAGQEVPLAQVERILRGVEAADRIVSDLLEYCRPIDLHPAPTPLDGLIGESLAQMRASSRRAEGIEVDLAIDPDLPPALGDRRLLLQVLANLYTNAIEAMDGEGRLSIRARAAGAAADPDRLRIVVRDTGCGLSAEEVARVFAPFYTTKPGGTGLGLALVRRIVETHGGRVHVVSAPGKGTSVVLDLPAAGCEAGIPEPLEEAA